MLPIMLNPQLVIFLSWNLIHSDKFIYSETEILIKAIFTDNEVYAFYYETLRASHILDLLRHGYIQVLSKSTIIHFHNILMIGSYLLLFLPSYRR